MISEHGVALRLKAGSEEAGYLAQIFPLPRTPTLVIIKNGELKEYLTPETSKEDFLRRVKGAFSATAHLPAVTTAPDAQASAAAPQTDSSNTTTPSQINTPSSSSTEPERSEGVRRILAERAARLQAQKQETERKAKEERTKAKGKAKAEAEAGVDTEAARTHKQQETLKKRRQQESEERRRILKRIEDDKAERKLRVQEREQQRIDNLKGGDIASSLVNAPETRLPSTTRSSDITALQVRLFDGSTLRSRFKTASPLKDVRKWVNANSETGKTPFTFKQVLTPLPNQDIDESEEDSTLGDLKLSPSSTLVLVPVKKFSSAYGDSPSFVSRLIGFILGIFNWILSLFGQGARPTPVEESSSQEESQDSSEASQLRKRRVKGFKNADEKRPDHQLYNGNSVRSLQLHW